MASGVAENMVSSLALVTVEGENTVLYLQTARWDDNKDKHKGLVQNCFNL